MKKNKILAGVLSTAMAAGMAVTPVMAENTAAQEGLVALMEEINQYENYEVVETVSTSIEGIDVELSVSAKVGKEAASDVNMAVFFTDAETGDSYFELALEDLFRATSDAFYINAGTLLETAAPLMEMEDTTEIRDMIGLTEDWISVSKDMELPIPVDACKKLVEDLNALYQPEDMFLDVVEVENGYQFTITTDTYVEMINTFAQRLDDETLATVIDDVLAIVAGFDMEALKTNAYVAAVIEGIQNNEPDFDVDAIIEALESEAGLSDIQDTLASLDGQSVVAMLNEQEISIADLTPMITESITEEGLDMNLVCTVTKEAEGSYTVVVDGQMAVEGETLAIAEAVSYTAIDEFEVEAPAAVDLTDVLTTTTTNLYPLIVELINSSSDDSNELIYEENSFLLLSSLDETLGAWVSFDETFYSLDTYTSDATYVFLDRVDGNGYVTISIDEFGDFTAYYESEQEWDTEATFSELKAIEGTELQYYTKTDEYGTELVFGTALDEYSCVTGDITLYEEISEEAMQEIAAKAITAVTVPVQ